MWRLQQRKRTTERLSICLESCIARDEDISPCPAGEQKMVTQSEWDSYTTEFRNKNWPSLIAYIISMLFK